MERSLDAYYILLFGIILLAGIFVSIVGNLFEPSGVTSYFIGTLALTIGDPNYLDEEVTVSNGASVDTGINITFDFVTNEADSSGFLNATKKTTNPESKNLSGKTALGKFFIIDSNTTFQSTNITFIYDESELGSLDESTLRVYKFNDTTENWRVLSGGVDTTSNRVWGTTTSFSTFGVWGDVEGEEGEPSPSTSGGGGGGSGGGGGGKVVSPPAEISGFLVNTGVISLSLTQEQIKSKNLKIKNTGNKALSMAIKIEGIEELTILSEDEFILDAGETKDIQVDVFATSMHEPGVYIGKIIVKGDSVQKSINVVIEVKKKSLFDLKSKILPGYETIAPGSAMFILVEIENIGFPEKLIDVNLVQSIMNFDETVFYESEKDTFAVGTKLSTIREFQIPSGIPIGKYLLVTEMQYNGTVIDTYDMFDVVEGKEEEKFAPQQVSLSDKWIIVLLGVLMFFSVIIILILYKKPKELSILPKIRLVRLKSKRKLSKVKSRIVKEKRKLKKRLNVLEEKHKLIEELRRLNGAYKKGVIPKEGYEKTKEALIKKIGKAKNGFKK